MEITFEIVPRCSARISAMKLNNKGINQGQGANSRPDLKLQSTWIINQRSWSVHLRPGGVKWNCLVILQTGRIQYFFTVRTNKKTISGCVVLFYKLLDSLRVLQNNLWLKMKFWIGVCGEKVLCLSKGFCFRTRNRLRKGFLYSVAVPLWLPHAKGSLPQHFNGTTGLRRLSSLITDQNTSANVNFAGLSVPNPAGLQMQLALNSLYLDF